MKTNEKMSIVFVGKGRIFQKHYEAVKQLGPSNAEIAAVVDTDSSKLEKIDNAVLSTNLDQVISDDVGNFGVVLTESGNHFECAKKLLLANYNVLVEKPITLRLEHAEELVRLANERNRKLYVVKQNRFNEPVRFARRMFKEGKLGKINIGTIRVRWCRPPEYYALADWRGTWKLDGGVITNQASHHVDLLCWFMGPVESVFAYEANFSADIEAEDTIVATLKFKSGALGTIEATTSIRPQNAEGSLSLIGTEGMVEVGGFAVNKLARWQSIHDGNQVTDEDADNDRSDVYGFGHVATYQEIFRDLNGEPNIAPRGVDGIDSLRLIHMIYKSVEECRTVFADEDDLRSRRLGHG